MVFWEFNTVSSIIDSYFVIFGRWNSDWPPSRVISFAWIDFLYQTARENYLEPVINIPRPGARARLICVGWSRIFGITIPFYLASVTYYLHFVNKHKLDSQVLIIPYIIILVQMLSRFEYVAPLPPADYSLLDSLPAHSLLESQNKKLWMDFNDHFVRVF